MATTKKEALAPDEARSRGKQIQELLDEETVEVPWQLRHAEYTYLGSEPLDRDHYISQEWCDKETENLWSRVWQPLPAGILLTTPTGL